MNVSDLVLFLKRYGENEKAHRLWQFSEEYDQLEKDLQYEKARRKLAEKMYLEEVDKSVMEKIFG